MKEESVLFFKLALIAFFFLIAIAVAGIIVYHIKIKKMRGEDD